MIIKVWHNFVVQNLNKQPVKIILMKNMKLSIKNIVCLLLVMLIGISSAKAEKEMKIEGIFQGVNLYIMNPFATTGVGFCITKITVNGKAALDDTNRSSIELNLSLYQLKKGEQITVIIQHKDGCTPKVLNVDALKPKSTFTLVSTKFDKTTNTFSFTTQGEIGSLPFEIEQFKWKKWVPVGKVQGKGTSGTNVYQVPIPLHSGINKIRIKQLDCTRKPRYSNEISWTNTVPEVTFKPGNNGTTDGKITFSRSTDYEIYDFYGKRLKAGKGTSIDVSSFPKGTYFINYDCKSESFEKK